MSEKYKEGLHRNQQLLFPPSLDEYVDENNQSTPLCMNLHFYKHTSSKRYEYERVSRS